MPFNLYSYIFYAIFTPRKEHKRHKQEYEKSRSKSRRICLRFNRRRIFQQGGKALWKKNLLIRIN